MSKSKENSTIRTSALQVVGVVYNHNKDDRSLRLLDFLQAGRDFDERYKSKTEEEEAERLKAENDQRVEELLAKAKNIKQKNVSENENQKDTVEVTESETGKLEQNSKPEENGDVVNKTEKPRSKADALERLRRMEWKRCQEDHRDISSNLRSSSGRQEFPPLTKSRNDDEYFSGTKVKKSREKKKNKEEVVLSLEELEKRRSTMPISEKGSRLEYAVPPQITNCWQNKAGAALFESVEQKTEDLELDWALRESLREQQEQEKRFMEILAGTRVETQRKPPGVMSFPPPVCDTEEDWDADEDECGDTEQSINHRKPEDKCQPEMRQKQIEKGNEPKEARNAMTKTATTRNKESQDMHDSVNGLDRFNNAQQRMNKLATNLSETLKQKDVQHSNENRSYAPKYHKRGEARFNRTNSQNDCFENKGKFEDGTGHSLKKPESSRDKSDTVHRQKSMDHGDRNEQVFRNIHSYPPASSNIKNDDLSSKTLPLEHTSEQKQMLQSDDISQSISALHIETASVRSCEEEKLAYQNCYKANVDQPRLHDGLTSLPSNKVLQSEAKTLEFNATNAAADMQHLTQAQMQQSQHPPGAAVSQTSSSSLNAQGVNSSAEHLQQQKQPLPSQNLPGQSHSPESYASLLEELQRIRMYQNFLMQMSAQESMQAAMQQQLQSLNALGASGSALTQEQLQTMLQMQHQQTLMPDLKSLLQPQTQNVYAPVTSMLQPQYPGTVLPSPKNASEFPQAPSVNSGDAGMVQKYFQSMLQQQQQHPSALLHAGMPGMGLTDKEVSQQQHCGGMVQPGAQASTTVHLSLQTSYPSASQSGYVGAAQYPQTLLVQQQYASKQTPPQSLTGAMPAASNAAETQEVSLPMLQQPYASSMHVARPPSPQRVPSMATNAGEATQYPQHKLQQLYGHLINPVPLRPPTMNPTNSVSAGEAPQYPQQMLLQQLYASSAQVGKSTPLKLPTMNPTATDAGQATQYPQNNFLQHLYGLNADAVKLTQQKPTGVPPTMNSAATNVDISAVAASQYNMRAQLMAAGIHNQHAMAGVVPLVPQEKPKSRGRGRLLRDSE